MNELRKRPRWIQPLDEVKKNSPSRREGISFDDELIRQAKGVNFIVKVAIQLKLPPMAIYTAAIYLHRFYTRYSLKIHYYECAAACVLLSSKTEEVYRPIHDVAAACMRTASKNPRVEIDTTSRDYQKWVDTITYTEENLLEALYFDLNIDSPYTHAATMSTSLGIADKIGILAENFINDSCRTLIGACYESRQIAAAGVIWAMKKSGISVDNDWIARESLDLAKLSKLINTMADMSNAIKQPTEPVVYERL